jgi:beta-mannosidase
MMDIQTEKQSASALRQYELRENWSFRQKGSEEWLTASVPGCNFTDLLRHGLIKDPFFRDNEAQLQWVEKEDWEYRTYFHCSEEDLAFAGQVLQFQGLDTFAAVYLNGVCILEADNMFRTYEISVAGQLQAGANELWVRFFAPVSFVADRAREAGLTYPAGNDHSDNKRSVFCRKAPYHFGWDWGPRFVTAGIWRPIRLLFFRSVRSVQSALTTLAADEDGGIICSEWTIESIGNQMVQLTLDIGDGQWSFEETVSLQPGIHTYTFTHELSDAQRWWPRGLGEPTLYNVRRTVSSGDVLHSETKDRFGLRTIRLIREADDFGRSFYFSVNDQPYYIKGANYIPQDSFLDRVTPERYRQVYADALAANMNMLRVWGGGIYEEDLFYELADENGVLIWQDFMFACSMYPGDSDFLASVKTEALDNMHRLKKHPSLALWCGNNEVEVGWKYWGWTEEYGYTPEQEKQLARDYQLLFERLLPDLVEQADPTRDYLASSPMYDYSETDRYADGDIHYWGVWHEEEPFHTFLTHVPRFMSEYGFQSFPVMESVQKYTSREDWSIDSPVMQLHQKHPRGNGIIKAYLEADYRSPKDFSSFLYLSQVLQAEGIRLAIEAHRGAKPFCMGTLYWQLNDCWPVASWSGIDYYGRWKALHYAVRDAYRDLFLVVRTEKGPWQSFLVSDLPHRYRVTCVWELTRLNGEILYTHNLRVDLAPQEKQEFLLSDLQAEARKYPAAGVCLRYRIETGEGVAYRHATYLVPVRELELEEPDLQWQVHSGTDSVDITVSSNKLVKNLYLWLPEEEGHFSDNFFDLFPGEPRRITLRGVDPKRCSPDRLRWTSIYQTYTD